jgi:hypothetical protein
MRQEKRERDSCMAQQIRAAEVVGRNRRRGRISLSGFMTASKAK